MSDSAVEWCRVSVGFVSGSCLFMSGFVLEFASGSYLGSHLARI